MNKFKTEQCRKTLLTLITNISKAFNHLMYQEIGKLGISNGRRTLLTYLSENDSAAQIDIVRHTHFKAPTVSVALQKLERDGFVSRHYMMSDRRKTVVNLTQKGREMNGTILDTRKETEDKIFAGFTDEERETLFALLEKAENNIAAMPFAAEYLEEEDEDLEDA